MTENPLIMLQECGQSVWLDDLTRDMLQSGELERPIGQDGVTAVTSNPKTFHQAITGGDDGFVSLEVSPLLARDTDRTIEEATRLWERVDRPNVLIKIPGTAEGLPAIRECLARGVSINITLLFSLDRCRQVLDAWFEAMSRRLRRGEPLTTTL